MSLVFAPHDDVVYDRAPLRVVLAQVMFDPILALLTSAGATGFQSAIRGEYSAAPGPSQRTGVRVDGDKVDIDQSAPVWRFASPDGEWTVGISVNFVSLETPSYTNFEDFLTRFSFVLRVLQKTLVPSSSTRIGLRKVNAIPLPVPDTPSSLAAHVRSELLGPLAWEDFPAPIGGAAAYLQFRDDLNAMNVRYGLEGDDSEASLLIDIDYFTNTPHTIEGDGAIIGLLRHFSEGCTSFFEWALKPEFKATLGPRPKSRGGAA